MNENHYENLINERFMNNEKSHKRIEEKLDAYILEDRNWKESLDKKYAGKWTENLTLAILGGVIVGLVILVITGINGAL